MNRQQQEDLQHQVECPVCGSQEVECHKEDQGTPLLGMRSVLIRNAEVCVCPDCGERTTAFPNHRVLLREIARNLICLQRTLRAEEFRALRNFLSLSQAELASKIGVTNVSVSRWETEAVGVDVAADKLLRLMAAQKLNISTPVSNLLDCMGNDNPDQVIEIDLDDYRGESYSLQMTGWLGARAKANGWKVHTSLSS